MSIIKERLAQKYRTLNWPEVQPQLSPRYRGKPVLTDASCGSCDLCVQSCPSGALIRGKPGHVPDLDLGRCVFCGACENACPEKAIKFSSNYRMAAFSREDLILRPVPPDAAEDNAENDKEQQQEQEQKNMRHVLPTFWKMFKKSFKLRQVSAGGCSACEADCNVLGTPVYDLGRFGVEFTASPRHADGLVLTGPLTVNMLPAFNDAWSAMSSPKILIAVGACAISGGLFRTSPATAGGVDKIADPQASIYIPGCPPNPWTILDGILKTRE